MRVIILPVLLLAGIWTLVAPGSAQATTFCFNLTCWDSGCLTCSPVFWGLWGSECAMVEEGSGQCKCRQCESNDGAFGITITCQKSGEFCFGVIADVGSSEPAPVPLERGPQDDQVLGGDNRGSGVAGSETLTEGRETTPR